MAQELKEAEQGTLAVAGGFWVLAGACQRHGVGGFIA